MKKIIYLLFVFPLLFSCGDDSESKDDERKRKTENAINERDERVKKYQRELDRRIKLMDASDAAGMSQAEIEKTKEENFNWDIIPKDADSAWFNGQREVWLD